MAANTQVQTVTPPAEKMRFAFTGILVVGGIAAYYLLSGRDGWMRWGGLLAAWLAAAGVFLTSQTGRQLIKFARESYAEVRKVVWPTRNETVQMTGFVFAFAVVTALFLWATDKTLEYVLYDLILQWSK